MLYFGPFNGLDRTWKAEDFTRYFSHFIANGVFPNPSTGLQVVAYDGMQIKVKPGTGWINGYYLFNDSDYVLRLDNADGVLKRIDRVVLRLNLLNREMEITVKKGVFASNPVAPDLQRDVNIHELALADVLVTNGALQITQANITDLRLNTELCGIVHGLIDQVDTTTIFNQYMAWLNEVKDGVEEDISEWEQQVKEDFMEWFQTIQDILGDDVATNLANRIAILTQELETHSVDLTSHIPFAVASGTANNYEITLTPPPTFYRNGMAVSVAINEDATDVCTLNVNGLGAVPIKKANGNDVKNLKANSVYTFRYYNGNFISQSDGSEYDVGNIITDVNLEIIKDKFSIIWEKKTEARYVFYDKKENCIYFTTNDSSLVKCDENGNEIWKVVLNNSGDIYADEDYIYIVSSSITLLDKTGNKIWRKSFGSNLSLADFAVDSKEKYIYVAYKGEGVYKIDINGNGSIIIYDNSSSIGMRSIEIDEEYIYLATYYSPRLRKYDKQGNEIRTSYSINAIPTELIADEENYLYCCGSQYYSSGGKDADYLYKLNKNLGVVWQKKFTSDLAVYSIYCSKKYVYCEVSNNTSDYIYQFDKYGRELFIKNVPYFQDMSADNDGFLYYAIRGYIGKTNPFNIYQIIGE